jgi:SAM-dependent methyltransferase
MRKPLTIHAAATHTCYDVSMLRVLYKVDPVQKTYDNFPQNGFTKQDPTSDTNFYSFPRMVAHIDNTAIAFLRDEVYTEFLPSGGVLLDMMSSLYSHYPDGLTPERVYGHGMNAQEMEANPALDKYVVQNLNENQLLPFETNQFDAVTNCVSVQYLEKPVEVFSEVLRVLKPGAPFIVSFSNRCFPSKAMRIWLNASDEGHIDMVSKYMELAGFTDIDTRIKRGGMLQGIIGVGGDPLYAVIGHKPG